MDEFDRRHLRELVHKMNTLNRKRRKVVQQYLQETGVHQAQHRLLMEISHNHYASQKELANLMEVSTATIAVSLKKLQKGGYINKAMNKADNRLNEITLTEKGKMVVEKSIEIFVSINEKFFRGLTKQEMDDLANLVQKLHINTSIMEDELKTKSERT